MARALNSKIIFRVFALTIITVSAWTFLGKPGDARRSAQGKRSVAVEVKQMDRVGRLIPVELKCATSVELKEPNALEGLSCILKNNTNKYITSGAIYTSVTLEKEGKTYVLSSYDAFDTFLHTDFREDHKSNLIPPGGEYPLGELPVSYDDALIQGLTVQVDYIEFADLTTTGSNRGGARIINDIREGAAKYKDWLVKKFDQGGRSTHALLPLLDEQQPLPLEELGIINANQEHGAILYLKYARRTYKAKGVEGLTKHFKQANSSVKN
jgi:hypothetical protein